jgi:XTP/dITP diphosphohydrolase
VYLAHAADPCPLIAQGVWEGRVAQAPRGTQGFGYDPVFEVPALGQTAAELATEHKQALSHRGTAVTELIRLLALRHAAS